MAYSTIEKKRCKCGCQKYPTLGYNGYAYSCAPEEIKEKVGSKRDVQRKNKNARMAISAKLRQDSRQKDITTRETFKEGWFRRRRQEMTGFCECGCKKRSSRDDEVNFRSSICHILPQKNFKSVQFHPLNFIEMSLWGGCHSNFDDRGSDRWPQLACWNKIVERFKILYPLTNPSEHKFIPQILLDTL